MIIPIPKLDKRDISTRQSIKFNEISFSLEFNFEGINQNFFQKNCQDYPSLSFLLTKHLKTFLRISESGNRISFIFEDLVLDGYRIIVNDETVKIYSGSDSGFFYAIMSLKQIANERYVNLTIEDSPDLKIRGVMLDISRDKVMSLSTAKEIIDCLAQLKINHLQLYVEGFSYEYTAFNVNQSQNFMKRCDFIEIEKYCHSNFIDFVPNQNGFGHMTEWLKLPEYKHLAMVDGLFPIWGSNRPSSTFDPTNKESVALVQKMYEEMLPHFKSDYFNMNFDEPYELGHGKSKEVCLKDGVGNVYLNYYEQCSQIVRKYHKTPMIWGDVLIKHPEMLDKLHDCVFIDWGYNLDYPFEQHFEKLEKAGCTFMAASGTSTWSMISSKYDDMIWSTKRAVDALIKHHGLGLLMTDWGDLGHLQYLPHSYPGIIYGAICSWNNDKSYVYLIKDFLHKMMSTKEAQVLLEMAHYSEQEKSYRSYSCKLFYPILASEHIHHEEKPLEVFLGKMRVNLLDEEEISNYDKYLKYLGDKAKTLPKTLISRELKNGLLLLETLINFHKALILYIKAVMLFKIDHSEFERLVEKTKQMIQKILKNHQDLWNQRNNPHGYQFSQKRISRLNLILDELKKEVNNYE